VGGSDLPKDRALGTIAAWSLDRLQNLRLSGGEPALWGGGPDDLVDLVGCARELGVGRVAISTNGSACIEAYARLIDAGVDDFSVSLDACCAEDGDRMSGGHRGSWEKVVENIRQLASWTYTTVGVVLTEDNEPKCREIVQFADSLGVADIRVIPAAQRGTTLKVTPLPPEILAKHSILRYRWDNLSQGRPVRGLVPGDASRCHLVLDDMAVMGGDALSLHHPHAGGRRSHREGWHPPRAGGEGGVEQNAPGPARSDLLPELPRCVRRLQ
jgi:MoaA/NifB/PqqE/SkfB family radical SAM enzyme